MVGRQALVLASSEPVAQGVAMALADLEYSARVVDESSMRHDIKKCELEAAVASYVRDDPDICVLGDNLFPRDAPPDQALASGMLLAFLVSRSLIRGMMRKRFGRLVTILPSLDRHFPRHASARGAMSGLMKSIGREVGTRGITANVVSLGHFPIEGAQLPAYLAVERWCSPKDIAHVLRFVLQEGSGYVTGQVIAVDGGLDA